MQSSTNSYIKLNLNANTNANKWIIPENKNSTCTTADRFNWQRTSTGSAFTLTLTWTTSDSNWKISSVNWK